MEQDQVLLMLRQGAEKWNAWREQNLGPIHLVRPNLYDSPDERGRQVKGRNRFDLSGMNLSGISFHDAFAEGVVVCDAKLEDAHFEEGDFSRANFAGSTFRNTKFNKTILTGASFYGSTIVNCNLNRVNMVGADFRVKEIRETVVYGISAWDLQTCDEMIQSNLVIEKTYGLYSDLVREGKVPMTVDRIELAEFIYFLTSHTKMRDTLNVLNQRGVLLLGRFEDGGVEQLKAVGAWLKGRGYMPMIFDFARPDSLDMMETVVTMAGLAKFIVADLSGPSVPLELQKIFDQFEKPVLAIGKGPAMLGKLHQLPFVINVQDRNADMQSAVEAYLPELERLHLDRMTKLVQSERQIAPGV